MIGGSALIQWLAALASGLLGSMGLGGGSVLIIYLSAFVGMEQMRAQGINLVFFIPVALLSLVIHTKNKLVSWRTAALALVGGLPGVFAGYYLAQWLGSELLSKFFGGFLLLIAVRTFYQSFQRPKESPQNTDSGEQGPH